MFLQKSQSKISWRDEEPDNILYKRANKNSKGNGNARCEIYLFIKVQTCIMEIIVEKGKQKGLGLEDKRQPPIWECLVSILHIICKSRFFFFLSFFLVVDLSKQCNQWALQILIGSAQCGPLTKTKKRGLIIKRNLLNDQVLRV